MTAAKITKRPAVLAMTGAAWNELRKAVTPFVSKDRTRPVLTMVRVRTSGAGAFAIDATDGYGMIRAGGEIGSAHRREYIEQVAVDATVNAGAFFSVRAKRSDHVYVTAGETGGLDVRCGDQTAHAARFIPEDERFSFPDLDIVWEGHSKAPDKAEWHEFAFSPDVWKKLAGLPNVFSAVARGRRGILSFRTVGTEATGRDGWGRVIAYRGAIMPVSGHHPSSSLADWAAVDNGDWGDA